MRAPNSVLSIVAASLALGACADDEGGQGGGEAASGTISVQVSGEELGPGGFLFPTGSEVTIADGWELHFDHVLVTIGSVWLSDNPDSSPSDQSLSGAVVARASGPWAIDLAEEGSVPGAGGEGTAIPLVTFEQQNENGDAPFAADQRYAFSFESVRASDGATFVNLGDDAATAYARAVSEGCSVLYVGRATFLGTACETSDETYDFDAIPTEVPFSFCFSTPTHYLNCQNEENQGDPFPDEEFQRGIPIFANSASVAQITLHLEHPFYADVQHEPALYFDQYAAALVGKPVGTELTLDLLAGIDPTGFSDAAGDPLPWRSCDGSSFPAGSQRAFGTGSVPVGPGEAPATGFRDYIDYASYVQSSQGHLNGGEGLCYTDRQYPSPP